MGRQHPGKRRGRPRRRWVDNTRGREGGGLDGDGSTTPGEDMNKYELTADMIENKDGEAHKDVEMVSKGEKREI